MSKLNLRSNGGFSEYAASSADFCIPVLLTCACKSQQLELVTPICSKEDGNAIELSSHEKGGSH